MRGAVEGEKDMLHISASLPYLKHVALAHGPRGGGWDVT